MIIDAGAAVVILLFILIGQRRGVIPSGLALTGTLIGAVLVDIWQDGVINLLERLGLATEWPLFLSLSGLLLLAVIVGYGIDTILELGLEDTDEWSQRLIGALVGLVNAGLVIYYLVRYAKLSWSPPFIERWLNAATLIPTVVEWLPWAMLGLTLGGIIMLGWRVFHTIRSARALQSHDDAPRSRQDVYLRVLEEINRVTDRRR
ncbi:CvpA family protein [Chloroflexus aggregans]|uniref:Colicin V production protein n=1 Tax=Chloroflexus aggregans (strain MD-66 / DSM 9485) TaxID=326427 RepID=B8GAI8_CHLAD|nr:CvpA family protein [Chloroflexus aggregans]ACL26563.1 colicin V production protein [Chloroflexus aggregans DSM 9485]